MYKDGENYNLNKLKLSFASLAAKQDHAGWLITGLTPEVLANIGYLTLYKIFKKMWSYQ